MLKLTGFTVDREVLAQCEWSEYRVLISCVYLSVYLVLSTTDWFLPD